jgi:competence protein ComFC
MDFLNNLVDFFLPTTCLFCGAVGDYVCTNCARKSIKFIPRQVCHVCKQELPASISLGVHEDCRKATSLDGAIVTCKYNKSLEKLVAEVKYNYYFRTAEYLIKLFERQNPIIQQIKADVVVPVPLHNKRLWKRGFNQAGILANGVGKLCKVRVVNLLLRKRNTVSQVGLGRQERIDNLQDVFEINKLLFENTYQKVLLIDDVMTTGTTLEECAKSLKSYGVKQVFSLAIARG